MNKRTRINLLTAMFGLMLGFTVTNIGFGDFGQLNDMFTFQDLRMFFAFAGAVVVTLVGFKLFVNPWPPRQYVNKGTVPGAILFGTGWAISGGCPSIPIIQVASGYLPATVTLVGIAIGMIGYRRVNANYLHFDSGSCAV